MAKRTEKQKLIDKLDDLWSKRVRERDNKCILCGKYTGEVKSLQAHHWILTRKQSAKYRWDIRNGVSLCYGCHIHQVHTNPSAELIRRLESLCIANGIATQDEINEIINDKHSLIKVNNIYVEDKIKELMK